MNRTGQINFFRIWRSNVQKRRINRFDHGFFSTQIYAVKQLPAAKDGHSANDALLKKVPAIQIRQSMKRLYFLSVLFSLLTAALSVQAQSGDHYYQPKPWAAKWIAPPGITGTEYGVYHFRKPIELKEKPAVYKVRISADNRYKLFVNSQLVSLGPARGDLSHWNYETVDLAPYLKAGKNIIAALVWNDGQYRNEAQITYRTGLIVQGNTAQQSAVNTDTSWKCIKDEGYRPIQYYFIAGPGQLADMRQVIKGWKNQDFDDSAWPSATVVSNGYPKGSSDAGWMLVPSPLPAMERTYQRIPLLRKTVGMAAPSREFPGAKRQIRIPADTTVTLLLDQTYLTNAYFTLQFSEGESASIAIGYAETLYENPEDKDKDNHPRKGHRDEVEGKFFTGMADSILSDGSLRQTYTSMFWRTYRYIQLRIHTRSAPLIIDDVYGTFTGYPFKLNARFNTRDTVINKILETGWRTARLDAMETYMDCPYYEQLQYIGDTRIQAMISYFNSGDDRLARNALNLIDHSRLPEGVTMSRWPSHGTQIISTFSLWYIGMLHDYWMYRPDSAFVRDKLPGARQVLAFFSHFQGADGSLKNLPYWKFVDWVGGPGWEMGQAPSGSDGSAAMLDLQLLRAYQWAGGMERGLGMTAFADLYRSKAKQLENTIREKYWNARRGLFADTREKNTYSQHVNAMAILANLIPGSDLPAFSKRLITDTTLVQCSIYFKYYLNQALVKGGLGDNYLQWLDIWRENLKMGLTTWAEDSNLQYARSDCHAWGASPNIEFYRTVLGIDSDGPGFRKVKIEPHPGELTNISGEIPHPNGIIKVSYRQTNGKWQIQIRLPAAVAGRFIWKGKSFPLVAGSNQFVL